MTVAELIGYLKQTPQDMEVMFDASEDPNFFIFCPIENIDIVGTQDEETIVLLHNGAIEDDEEDLSYLN